MNDQLDKEMRIEDAVHRFGNGRLTVRQVWETLRSTPTDLRAVGLTVAVHNDYKLGGKPHTFWLMTGEVGQKVGLPPIVRAFKGEGATDMEALDQIRAAWAEATDDHHHAPMCAANHYHGMRAPTGPCSCGAVEASEKMRRR